ncbi:MAG: TerD family protein [Azoarcus sp.]|jgi:tellurite resistance protein TerA|nr:TerD family protein [Azoarcus sp.]
MQLSRGQRARLADLGLADTPFAVELQLNSQGLTIDASCFGLDAAKRLSDERYMVFFNQRSSPCGGIKLTGADRFEFDLARLPASIESLVIALALDGAGQMSQLGACTATFRHGASPAGGYAFDGSHFAGERAVMLIEIYRKDGAWRTCAVGQGFNGGLDALVEHFGGQVAGGKPNPQTAAPAPAPVPASPPPAPPPPKVSLSKITLEKRGDKISLEKRGGSTGHGRIVCNLNWSSGAPAGKKGLFGKLFNSKGIDLDLGCLFEMSNGLKGAIQALGKSFGSYDKPPYIHMAGDDRTGANAAGEFLYINGDHLKEIKRICVFAFIYEGVANWGQADAIVTVAVPGHPPIEVRLDNHDNQKNMCAIAMLENDGNELKITKLATYFRHHMELDRHYNWGLRWAAGSK